MEPILILILALLTGSFAILSIYLALRGKTTDNESQNTLTIQLQQLKDDLFKLTSEQRREMTDQIRHVEGKLTDGIDRSQTSIQRQFEQTTRIVRDVTERLTALDKTNKQVLDFSGQLQQLQHILKNPKQRGVLGEYWLETLLSNVMPSPTMYAMQYTIGKTDEDQALIADAVIFLDNLLIPIDAKFSLENYNRMMEAEDVETRQTHEKALKSDVKRRIDETSKYIRPDLNTMDFAFMFIPAEGVYYNLLNAEVGSGINSANLVEYAFSKKVIIISPTSFYAYLQTVLMGLRKLEIEKSTQEIIKRVGELHRHLNSYADYHDKLGKNLGTVVNHYNASTKELGKVSKDILRITDADEGLQEFDSIDKPLLEP